MYILFILCVVHAIRRSIRHVSYLLGGVLFGLMLEYINVIANMGYTYGKFAIMFGKSPLDIPLCIGIGWGTIMYSARMFSDSYRLPLWAAAAADTLFAISIDLSMDAVAYRLHMWHWNWDTTRYNPLTADWFGIPFGNFFGWLMVVFFYSSISRLLERAFLKQKKRGTAGFAFVPLFSVLLSEVFLFLMLMYVVDFLNDKFGITRLHMFVAFLIVLIIVTFRGWQKRTRAADPLPLITWVVPLWFHLFFFAWLFIGGFYRESTWLVIAASLNMLIGVGIHFVRFQKRSVVEPLQVQTS